MSPQAECANFSASTPALFFSRRHAREALRRTDAELISQRPDDAKPLARGTLPTFPLLQRGPRYLRQQFFVEVAHKRRALGSQIYQLDALGWFLERQ